MIHYSIQRFICQQNVLIYIKIHQSIYAPFIYNNEKMPP